MSGPFPYEIEKPLGEGVNSRVYPLGSDHVLRIQKEFAGPGGVKELYEEKAYYDCLKQYLGDYVPDALFIIGEPINGCLGYVVVPRIEGHTLDELSDEEYYGLSDQLADILRRMLHMMDREDLFFDYSGNLNWFPFYLSQFRHSVNIVVVEGENGLQLCYRDIGSTHPFFEIPGIREFSKWVCRKELERALFDLECEEP